MKIKKTQTSISSARKALSKIALLFAIIIFGASAAFAANLEARFNYAKYYAPDDGPYIETFMTVIGNSATFVKNENNKFQASVAITYLFKQNGEVVDFRKYNLMSPEVEDTSLSMPNFIDIQRISLANGAYNLEVIIQDVNRKSAANDSTGTGMAKPFKMTDVFTIDFNDKTVQISDIAFIESFTKTSTPNVLSKSGYDMVPYVSNYFPENISEMIFYSEIYNLLDIVGAENKVLLKYYIESYETKQAIDKYNKFQRLQADKVNVVFSKFDIKDLPSGNYNLVIEIRNQQNEVLVDKRYYLQRNNPGAQFAFQDLDALDINATFIGSVTSMDVMRDYILCVQPIAESREKKFSENLLLSEDITLMKQFFFNFWVARNALNPEQEWAGYKLVVDNVNREFSTMITKGYATDRGRIYLQYGAPNIMRERKHEPETYPFQIWQYNELNGKMNQKFLFYNNSFADQDYQLLHSNVLGEMQTKNWIYYLRSNTTSPTNLTDDLDNEVGILVDENYGSSALEIWENP